MQISSPDTNESCLNNKASAVGDTNCWGIVVEEEEHYSTENMSKLNAFRTYYKYPTLYKNLKKNAFNHC